MIPFIHKVQKQAKLLLILGEYVVTRQGHKGGFENAGDIFFLDLGSSYKAVGNL